MPKTFQRELDTRHAPLPQKAEELRRHLLSDDGIRERVSFRAHELFQRRGGEQGRDLEDWAQAENEILSTLIEREVKLSLELSAVNSPKRGNSETAEQVTKVAPQQKTTSGKLQKSEATRTEKTKPRSR